MIKKKLQKYLVVVNRYYNFVALIIKIFIAKNYFVVNNY